MDKDIRLSFVHKSHRQNPTLKKIIPMISISFPPPSQYPNTPRTQQD